MDAEYTKPEDRAEYGTEGYKEFKGAANRVEAAGYTEETAAKKKAAAIAPTSIADQKLSKAMDNGKQ